MANAVEKLRSLVNDGTDLQFADVMIIEQVISEITSLRSQLEEARENALEEAAKVAEKVGRPVGASDGSTYVPGTSVEAAAAIRKLKGVTKPKPVPSLGKLFDDLATKQRLIGEEFEKFMTDVEDTTEADGEGAIRKLKEKP